MVRQPWRQLRRHVPKVIGKLLCHLPPMISLNVCQRECGAYSQWTGTGREGDMRWAEPHTNSTETIAINNNGSVVARGPRSRFLHHSSCCVWNESFKIMTHKHSCASSSYSLATNRSRLNGIKTPFVYPSLSSSFVIQFIRSRLFIKNNAIDEEY